MRKSGDWVRVGRGAGAHLAFVPFPLPPRPRLAWGEVEGRLLDQARIASARLDGLTALLPDVSLFVYAYVRKEALTSSQIEGTQSSYSDLLLYESDLSPGVPLDDVQEVSDCVAAMQWGLDRLSTGARWSARFLCALHRRLMQRSRGRARSPGQLRRTTVWLGGDRPSAARFVPPPPEKVPACLAALVRFLESGPPDLPPLVRAALAHAQFETIHPFRDGNGRLGRMLITLMLCSEGALEAPLLYTSTFFKAHRREYYDRLQAVRTAGDWEGWIRFFLEGVQRAARDAAELTRRSLALFDSDRQRIAQSKSAPASALLAYEALQRRPILSARDLESRLRVTYPTASAALERLRALGIARELTGYRRNRLYAYDAYVRLLNEGTEPLR